MTTKWAVTVATDPVTLDDQRRGEAAFTVTNPGPAADRVVFDVVPDEGADGSWFSVSEPQRLVRGGASVSFVMKVAVPAEAVPGSYAVQGLVYSADSAPEESSVLSPRVVLEVPVGEGEPSRRWPWWWFAVAGLVVVVLAVVIVLVATGGGDDEGVAGPRPTPTVVLPGVMPDVVGLTESEAARQLARRRIGVEPRYLHDPDQAGTVLGQSVPPGGTVGSAGVTLDLAVALPAPVLIEPVGVVAGMTPDSRLELVWEPGDLASSWNVVLAFEHCNFFGEGLEARRQCYFFDGDPVRGLDEPSYHISLAFAFQSDPGRYFSGWFRWQVEPLDADGNPGPISSPVFVRVGDIRP